MGLQLHVSCVLVNDNYSRNALKAMSYFQNRWNENLYLSQRMRSDAYRICTKDSFKKHAGVFSGARSLNFSPSLQLHPYIMHARNEGSGETAHMRRLA